MFKLPNKDKLINRLTNSSDSCFSTSGMNKGYEIGLRVMYNKLEKIQNEYNLKNKDSRTCENCSYYDNKCLNVGEGTRGFCVKFGLTIGFIKSNFGKDFGCNKFERKNNE